MKKIIFLIMAVLLCFGVAVVASCFTRPEFTDVSSAIRAQITPIRLTTTVQLRIGSLLLSTANLALKLIPANHEAAAYVREIRSLQIGVYAMQSTDALPRMVLPPEVGQHLTEAGWEPFVRVRQEGLQASLFYKQITPHVAGVYVVVVEQEHVVVIEIQGALDKIIEKALQYHEFPQLYT
jgi:hypothetical protein